MPRAKSDVKKMIPVNLLLILFSPGRQNDKWPCQAAANRCASEYSPKSDGLVRSGGFFAGFYPLPDPFVVQGHTVVIDQNIGDESSSTAGVAIFTVRQTKIFLLQRLQDEFWETHPRRDKLAAGLSNFQAQSPDWRGVRERPPAQINVECSFYRLIFGAFFKPASVLRRDLQFALTRRIADGNTGCHRAKQAIALDLISRFCGSIMGQGEDCPAEGPFVART